MLPEAASALVAIGSVFGMLVIGKGALAFNRSDPVSRELPIQWLFGCVITSQMAFFLIAFGLLDLLSSLGFLLCILGLYYLVFNSYSLVRFVRARFTSITLLTIVCFAFYALMPLTNADSIDYHIGFPLAILREGFFTVPQEWLSARLFGFGEFLNLLGLKTGTEKLGALCQAFSLVMILICIKKQVKVKHLLVEAVFEKLVIAAPLLIFLIGTAKFQLLPIALVVWSVFVSFNYWRSESPAVPFVIAIFLATSATLYKYNFMLSGCLACLYAVWQFRGGMRRNLLLLSMAVIVFCINMLPFFIFKSFHVDSGLFATFLSPSAGEFVGSDAYEEMLRSYSESRLAFPISFLVPDSLGKITSVIGLGLLAFFALKAEHVKENVPLTLLICILLLLLIIFAQYSARTFLDLYFIGLLLLAGTRFSVGMRLRLFDKLLLLQNLGVVSLLAFGIYSGVPAYFSEVGRERVRNEQANGYAIASWVDSLVTDEPYILVTNRSMSFFKNKVVAGDWIEYVDWSSPQPFYYLERLKGKSPLYLFYLVNDRGTANIDERLESCVSNQVLEQKSFSSAVRNPFNKSTSIVRLARIELRGLISCVKQQQAHYSGDPASNVDIKTYRFASL